MNKLTIGRLLALTLLSALIGSTLGTAIYFADYFFGHPNVYPLRKSSDLMFFPVIWMMSLFGTIPGALIIGAPAVYPFRMVIARYPYISCIPTVLLSCALSFALLGWAFQPQGGGEYRDLEMLWSYAGSTALGFVYALGWWGKHYLAKADE